MLQNSFKSFILDEIQIFLSSNNFEKISDQPVGPADHAIKLEGHEQGEHQQAGEHHKLAVGRQSGQSFIYFIVQPHEFAVFIYF